MNPSTGWLIGHFEPLHRGHVRLIQHAVGLVDKLHIVILQHPNPNPAYPVSLEDKARWLQKAFNPFNFIQIHTHAISNLDPQQPQAAEQLASLRQALGIDSQAKFISDEHHLWGKILPADSFIALPHHQAFDSEAIHQNPVQHWLDIHPTARREYSKTIAIVGGESSGKTTLVYKLANYYLADYVLEQGRLYVDYALGGSELALQYSDYRRIAQDHAQAIEAARQAPKAPLIIIDTDFITTQAFCQTYEGKRDPLTAAYIDQIRFDHTLLLANNTAWVNDGLRSLGSQDARQKFQALLKQLYQEHHIAYHEISASDYQSRYCQAVKYLNHSIYQL